VTVRLKIVVLTFGGDCHASTILKKCQITEKLLKKNYYNFVSVQNEMMRLVYLNSLPSLLSYKIGQNCWIMCDMIQSFKVYLHMYIVFTNFPSVVYIALSLL
jgi:hypothetical protein